MPLKQVPFCFNSLNASLACGNSGNGGQIEPICHAHDTLTVLIESHTDPSLCTRVRPVITAKHVVMPYRRRPVPGGRVEQRADRELVLPIRGHHTLCRAVGHRYPQRGFPLRCCFPCCSRCRCGKHMGHSEVSNATDWS